MKIFTVYCDQCPASPPMAWNGMYFYCLVCGATKNEDDDQEVADIMAEAERLSDMQREMAGPTA